MNKIVLVFCTICLLFVAPAAFSANYYVSVNGNDANSGTSSSTPWKSLTKVNNSNFSPGDIISFQCGGTWTGNLNIHNSGASGNPITFTSYGSGTAPIMRNPGTWTFSISINANWIIVEKFLCRDSHEAGILVAATASNNTIRNCEFIADGAGVECRGSYNLITRNQIHDLSMVVNTAGGDDDYGAEAIIIRGPYNEASYNQAWNCKAQSYDYGYDGGMIELYANADNTYVHHNWAQDCNGFLEVGGNPGSAKNVTIAYNVSINNGGSLAAIHNSGSFASAINNFKMENNTIIDTSSGWSFLWFASTPAAGQFIFRNNIVEMGSFSNFSNVNFDRTNNLFHFLSGTTKLVNGSGSLKTGEMFGDPLFVNRTTNDLHLQGGSPCIERGLSLGYTLDYENNPVPSGTAPDIGAYEYGNARPSAPTNLRIL